MIVICLVIVKPFLEYGATTNYYELAYGSYVEKVFSRKRAHHEAVERRRPGQLGLPLVR